MRVDRKGGGEGKRMEGRERGRKIRGGEGLNSDPPPCNPYFWICPCTRQSLYANEV